MYMGGGGGLLKKKKMYIYYYEIKIREHNIIDIFEKWGVGPADWGRRAHFKSTIETVFVQPRDHFLTN